MPPTLTVPVAGRVPLRTKIRINVGRALIRMHLVTLAERMVSTLAIDVKVGSRDWQRQYFDVSFEER
jgi:hypothetical protein